MLIVCPNCATSYDVDAAKLGADGRLVRCARCRTQWLAKPEPEPVAAMAAAPGAEQATDAATTDEDAADWGLAPADEGSNTETQSAPASGAADPEAAPTVEAPPLAPTGEEPEPGKKFDPTEPLPEDIETIAARRAQLARERSARRSWQRMTLPVAILALATVVVALLGWRTQVVRIVPQSARLYAAIGLPVNLRGLAFEEVKTTDEMQDGVPVLVITGTIVSVSKGTVDVPRLRFAVRNAGGIEIYAWTALPSQPFLSPGERLPFRSRLASPPASAHDVVVRFFHRRDLAGTQ